MTARRLEAVEDVRAFIERSTRKHTLRVSTVGSVDDGKSTLIGRLLHDTKSIYEDHLSALKADSARVGTGPELDFALLTDGLKAEREQKITIDVAYRYFSTPTRTIIIADTPGHEQYTRNMATGASTAHLAIILVDARHGVLIQTKRHSFIASLLGIPRLVVAVNKMDLVGYAQAVFERTIADYRNFATRLGVPDLTFIPISALQGDNVVERSRNMPWYDGDTILGHLQSVYVGGDLNLVDFRLPVQCVLRPHPTFRGFAGQIASGIVRLRDEIIALPSMKTSRVRSILSYAGEHDHAFAPMSVTLVLDDEIDVSRGDTLAHVKNLPRMRSRFEAMVLWLSEVPMRLETRYLVKHTTRTSRVALDTIEYRVDVNSLSRLPPAALRLNEIARISFRATESLFLDPYARNRLTGSFILIDPETNHTVGAGMVIDRSPEDQPCPPADPAAAPRSANIQRESGHVSALDRERLLGQRAVTMWFTGLSGSGKSSIARDIERRLFERGRHVYILDGDNLRFGLNRDLSFSKADRAENIRRIAEVARLLNDAGTVVLVPVISPFRDDRDSARRIIGEHRFYEIYVSTPLNVCESRDAKALYRKARAGEIQEFTGVSSPYEPPETPFLTLDTAGRTVEESGAEVLAATETAIAMTGVGP